jgi:magnesium-transporting ATPase (P-type)
MDTSKRAEAQLYPKKVQNYIFNEDELGRIIITKMYSFALLVLVYYLLVRFSPRILGINADLSLFVIFATFYLLAEDSDSLA